MRVAAVALVLLVGAGVVLAFANTLNSWVLGGLLGGLAAILISIPISLALFTILARRHENRQQPVPEEEPQFSNEYYEELNDRMVIAAEGYLLPGEEDLPALPPRAVVPNNRRFPISGYLNLPEVDEDEAFYERETIEERFDQLEPRNYPRQPRRVAQPLTQHPQPPAQGNGSRRPQSTHSLSQHQSAALRAARQEARQRRLTGHAGSASPSRRPQEHRQSATQHPRTSRNLPSQDQQKALRSRKPISDPDIWATRQERPWRSLDEDGSGNERTTPNRIREQYQQYPRNPRYPRQQRSARYGEPLTGELDYEDDYNLDGTDAPRSRYLANRTRNDLKNPLVRRAPYLYEDDPLREEFAQQLGPNRPFTRRSSRYEQYEDDEEF